MDYRQLIFATAVLKKAQEVTKGKATVDIKLLVPKPLNMAKFILKASYRFIKDIEVKAFIIAHFLFN